MDSELEQTKSIELNEAERLQGHWCWSILVGGREERKFAMSDESMIFEMASLGSPVEMIGEDTAWWRYQCMSYLSQVHATPRDRIK